MNTVQNTDYPDLQLVKRGKVRDMYDLGDCLLLVASDRISAFDVVMPEGIPDKGKILNQFFLKAEYFVHTHPVRKTVPR